MVVAFTPCLGSLNWINIPFALVGLIVSIAVYTTTKDDRKGGAMGGLVLCGLAVVAGLIRLYVGGGLL